MKIGNFLLESKNHVEIFEKIIYNKNVWNDFPKNFIKNSKSLIRFL